MTRREGLLVSANHTMAGSSELANDPKVVKSIPFSRGLGKSLLVDCPAESVTGELLNTAILLWSQLHVVEEPASNGTEIVFETLSKRGVLA